MLPNLPPAPDRSVERRAVVLRYVTAVALGVVLTWAISAFGVHFPRNVFFIASLGTIAAIALVGGFGPAAVTTTMLHAASAYYMLAPTRSFKVADPGDVARLLVALTFCCVGCAIEGQFRRERRRLKSRERELLENAWRYRLLLEEASDAIVVFDAAMRVQMANARAEELLGRPRAAMRGMTCQELLQFDLAAGGEASPSPSAVPSPPGALADEMASARSDASQPPLAERAIMRPDGSRLVGELSARALPDGSVQVIVRDVTSKHNAAEAVRAERDLLDGIIATSSSAIVALDVATQRPIFANQRFLTVTGRRKPERAPAAWSELPWEALGDDGRPLTRDELPFLRVVRTGAPVFDVPLTVRFHDGRVRRVRVNAAPLRDAAGRLTTVVQTIDDVTERLQTERALVASEQQLQHIAQAFPGAVFQCVFTPAGAMRFTYVSDGIRELIGVPADDAVADVARVWACIAPEMREEVRHAMRRSAATNQPWRADVQVTTTAGQAKWVRGTAYPESDRVDGVVRWNGIFLDVTDFKELESHLMQAQKMESIGRLAGGIAHDFNNILTAIRGNVDLLLDDLDPSDGRTSEVKEIRDAAERAGTLTSQLLAFSRKQFRQPRDLDLNALVRDVEKMLRRVIGEDIALLTVPGDSLGMVRADPGQLQQVLLNLVVNARDAMPDGGLLTIDTRNVRLSGAAAAAAGLPPGEYTCLVVRDTGHGMTADVQARIFEPFFTTKAQGRGTGLGLSMVYGILQQSGGAITVESAPERGSTFRLYLPRVRVVREPRSSPSGTPEVTPVAAAEEGSAPMILLVEDDAAVRQLATRMLVRAGYSVRAAADAYEALTLADATCSGIDLVISDVVMPGLGGRELSHELRRRCPQLRLLFISGYTDIDSGRLELDRRTRLLHKPFTQEALVHAVQDMLALPIPA